MKPSTLHDPLKDVGTGFAPANPFDLRLPLIVLVTLLLIGIALRARRTPAFDPEYPARRDMARLIGVVWGGLIVEWVRSHFDLATPGFLIASLFLLPFVVGAVAFSVRLLRAYRAPHSVPAAPGRDK